MLKPAIRAALPSAIARPVAEARFLSPVQQPTKIIGVPVNYHEHVVESEADVQTFSDRFRGSIEQQGFFLKAVSALVGPGEGIALRFPRMVRWRRDKTPDQIDTIDSLRALLRVAQS